MVLSSSFAAFFFFFYCFFFFFYFAESLADIIGMKMLVALAVLCYFMPVSYMTNLYFSN